MSLKRRAQITVVRNKHFLSDVIAIMNFSIYVYGNKHILRSLSYYYDAISPKSTCRLQRYYRSWIDHTCFFI